MLRLVRSGRNLLAEIALIGPRQGQGNMARQLMVHMPEGQKQPSVFQNIKSSRDIPKRRHQAGNLPGDPGELPVKSEGILNMFNRMGTQYPLKLFIPEG